MSREYPDLPRIPGWATLGTLTSLSAELVCKEFPPYAENKVQGAHLNRGWMEHGGAEVDLSLEAIKDREVSNDVYSLLEDPDESVQYILAANYKSTVNLYPPELHEAADLRSIKLPARRRGAAVLYVYSLYFVYSMDEFHWREQRNYMLGNRGKLAVSVDVDAGNVGDWIDEVDDQAERIAAIDMGVPHVVNPAKLRLLDALTLFKAFEQRDEIMPFEHAVPALE